LNWNYGRTHFDRVVKETYIGVISVAVIAIPLLHVSVVPGCRLFQESLAISESLVRHHFPYNLAIVIPQMFLAWNAQTLELTTQEVEEDVV
jgi:hypothetical protein